MKIKLLSFSILLLTVLMTSCGDSTKQFEHAGGTFTFAIANEPTTLIAREVTDLYSAIVLNQVLEGLVTLDPKTLKPTPAIAKSWEIKDNGQKYVFDIRENIYFHSHELIGDSRKLTPEDVKYSIELACKKQMGKKPSNAYKSIYKNTIKGANEYHNGEAEEVSGIEIKDGKLTINLVRRDANFLDKLAQTTAMIVCKELVEAEKETDLVGTGPFVFDRYLDNDGQMQIVLKKNQKYYLKDEEGNQLPYLDSLVYIVESKSLECLEMFEQGKTQLIDGLPPSRITSMLEGRMDDFNSIPPKMILRRKPLLATQFYHFNMLNEAFEDVKVRQAINYAVDRQDIVQNVLNNQAYSPGHAGLIPPAAFSGYDSKTVKEVSYKFNPEKAKKLLAEAGYPNGEGFPVINLKFNIGSIHSGVADRFAKHMKKYLNIIVNLDGLTFEDKLRDQQNANGDIFRSSWYADYYSPETFLTNAYGKVVPALENEPSPINHSRYKNEDFDKAFEAGQASDNIQEQFNHYAKAERIMMKDAPFIILWYEETIKIADANVRNLELNEMNYYSFKEVYLKEWTKEEYQEKTKAESTN